MRLAFMGTPHFAEIILEQIAQQHEVVAVYTRPDAVRGRGKALVASPVKALAEILGIPVYTPTTLKDPQVVAQLASYAPEALVVAAYGMIIPDAVLAVAPHGALNAHASLLPRWRGAAPIERALLAGDAEVGVCAMRVDHELDAGPYCASRSIPVGQKSVEELTEELAYLGAEAILSGLQQFQAGRVFWVDQDESQVTYAHKIEKGELNLQSADTAEMAQRKVQASGAAHPCKCVIAGKEVAVLRAQACAELPGEPPAHGEKAVLFFQKRLYLQMSSGYLEILELKPDGKKEMDARAFAAGVQNIKSCTLTWRLLYD